ncbi:MAG: hypothetical protein FWC02_03400 [Firmicutes bacterium]|nr:hypothetical protein [Bacillota bacterium]
MSIGRLLCALIEEFGFMNFEELNQIMPKLTEEFFNAFNGQYLLISMGKGMVTWCDIEYLVGRFL